MEDRPLFCPETIPHFWDEEFSGERLDIRFLTLQGYFDIIQERGQQSPDDSRADDPVKCSCMNEIEIEIEIDCEPNNGE